MNHLRFLFFVLILISPCCLQAQKGTKERIKIHSKALEGNLIGDPADRDVSVYLPPSYNANPDLRYPVLYFLHGFTDSDSQWFGWEDHWINIKDVIDASLAEGLSDEMIVVMPNAYNSFKGSMYSSSVTIGDWETFVVKELVDYIDTHYRTIAEAKSRGLAGHSMGGYGTMRLGMKFPDVFAAIYAMSPCCMDGEVSINEDFVKKMESYTTLEQLKDAPFFEIATLATSSAWAPNPENPPYYLDLPFEDGKVRHDVASKIAANRTLYTIEQYIPNIKSLEAIGLDAGTNDYSITTTTKKLHELLESYEISHQYESYEGDHLNRIAERIKTRTLPFFSENLRFE